MLMGFRKSSWKWVVGSCLMAAAVGSPWVSQAQSPGDVIRIGNSPSQWSQYEGYWNQLINLSGASKPAASSPSAAVPDAAPTAQDPQVIERQLASNLRVSNVRLASILGLPGSSQVMGSITNNNRKAVTVASVNLEVYKANGELAQTVAARPQPATIAPGATVTFVQQLLTVPADSGFRARLSRTSPFSIEGGV